MKHSTPLLSLRDLHFAFKGMSGPMYGQREILHGINLDVQPGEALALVGESGSGKSVTALAIMQLLGDAGAITSGEIIFNGEAIHTFTAREMSRLRGSKMGMVFQDPMTSLNPTMTIGRQIAEVLTTHENMSQDSAKKHAIDLLKRVGISDAAERYAYYPFQLSGGMRQRVLIAMAIACKPALLIADEPTTALDVTIQAQILDLLRQLRQETGTALLFITHDLGIVASLCDRAAVMQQGKIVETASVDVLFSRPEHPYTRTLLQARHGDLNDAQ